MACCHINKSVDQGLGKQCFEAWWENGQKIAAKWNLIEMLENLAVETYKYSKKECVFIHG